MRDVQDSLERRPGAAEADVVLTLTVAGQACGVPVRCVRDVLGPQAITRIPLAPPQIAGGLNLRGRIVTAIDLRRRLDLPPRPPGADGSMSVVVEQGAELYSLLCDGVGEVMSWARDDVAANPPTLDNNWRGVSLGVHRGEDGGALTILLDVERVLAID